MRAFLRIMVGLRPLTTDATTIQRKSFLEDTWSVFVNAAFFRLGVITSFSEVAVAGMVCYLEECQLELSFISSYAEGVF